MPFRRRHYELHERVKADDLSLLSGLQRAVIVARLAALDGWQTFPYGRGRIRCTSLPHDNSYVFALFVKRIEKGGFGILHIGESQGPDPPPAAYKLAEARLETKPAW